MILIKNISVLDVENKKITKKDILIDGSIIKKVSDHIKIKKVKTLRFSENLLAIPSLIDMHVHSRVYGNEEAEDFKSLNKACLSGGIASIVVMPNTNPPTDNYRIIRELQKKAKCETNLNVFFTSAATERREGKRMVDVKKLSSLVIGFTDDGSWVRDIEIMTRLLIQAKRYGKTVLSHCEIPHPPGYINKGRVSRILKIPAIACETEYLAVFRDILLAIALDAPLHLQHISTKKSVQLIREAKKLNPRITAETAPHYFCFTEENISNLNTDFKMNPPLRTEEDRKEIIKGIKDNTIEVIATDHAPHTQSSKSLPIDKAPYGVIGVETLLASSLTELHRKNSIPLEDVISKITINPATIAKINKRGAIKEGYFADISIIDPDMKWKVDRFFSKSSNSPFKGTFLYARNLITIINGKIRYEYGKFFI